VGTFDYATRAARAADSSERNSDSDFRRTVPDLGDDLEERPAASSAKKGGFGSWLTSGWDSFVNGLGLQKVWGDGVAGKKRKALMGPASRPKIYPMAKRSWMQRLFGAKRPGRREGLPEGMTASTVEAGGGWADALVDAREGGWDSDGGAPLPNQVQVSEREDLSALPEVAEPPVQAPAVVAGGAGLGGQRSRELSAEIEKDDAEPSFTNKWNQGFFEQRLKTKDLDDDDSESIRSSTGDNGDFLTRHLLAGLLKDY